MSKHRGTVCDEEVAQELFAKGDYGELVVYLQPVIYNVLARSLNHHPLTAQRLEDLAQDISIKLLRLFGNYNPSKAPIISYTVRAVTNTMYDDKMDSLKQSGVFQIDPEYFDVISNDEPVDTFSYKDSVITLAQAMDNAKLDYFEARTAFKLLFFLSKGYEFNDIAKLCKDSKIGLHRMYKLINKLRESKQ